jgi:microsomal dipeptidase-like Zn-dependent dipeptidase
MTDDMLRALAKNGGVVMINYHAAFLSEEFALVGKEERHATPMSAMSWKAAATRRARRWRSRSTTRRWRVASCRR